MKEGWSTRWKALLIWACGYLSIIAFALAGGYAIVKSDDEKLKQETKKAFIVTLIYTAITLVFTLFTNLGGLFDNQFYSSSAYSAYNVISKIVTIAECVVYVVFASIAFFGNGNKTAKPETYEENQKNKDAVQEDKNAEA